MKNKVAIVTYVSKGTYDHNTADENQILAEILDELGIENELIPWSDKNADWSKFDFLLIKSTWDYFDHYEEFRSWLDHLEMLQIPVLNSLEILRWNSDKSYLFDVEKMGFPVISGKKLAAQSSIYKDDFEGLPFDEFVIKPLVSGGAKNTFRLDKKHVQDFLPKLNSLLEKESFLIQPFVKEVAEVGEYSLIYFNSIFSHAVLKTPAQEDFRVQHYFGGTIKAFHPDQLLLDSVQVLVDRFCQNSLYARVDGVIISGVFHLMELEMIEPYLFLVESEGARKNYKEALERRLFSQLQRSSAASP
ncbi:ATP-grasp domain-containing protein [Algoriphagus sediminis]|uniref:Glutathione synthetase n=1 Tax=Algoriphagus sediminis TaxID=3057113 RepID=A0ABT7YAH9_9BACT|nr:glutathione synthetase [Algoriphagus sediminis]MDN3203532.1 glutathione synthetase [Algoriphagus sediminis]